MMHTVLGLEVKTHRVDFAVHEVGPITHKFVKNGSLHIPSSQTKKEDHDTILNDLLTQQFSSLVELGDCLSVYCESYTDRKYVTESYKWIHEQLSAFFAENTEIMGIPLVGSTYKIRRKAILALDNLQNYGWTMIIPNYIAYEGGCILHKDIYDF